MPAVDLFQEWQRAEAACVTAYQAMYIKVRSGVFVSADEMERLAKLSREARASYHGYLEQMAGSKLLRPECLALRPP